MKDLVKEYISDLGNNPLCTTLNKGRVRLSTILDDFNEKALKNMESSSSIKESRTPISEIRNKLSPISNLIAMLEDMEYNTHPDSQTNALLLNEFDKCKRNIKLLSDSP